MATRKIKDLYCERAMVSVTESAQGTITFNQIQFAAGVFQQMAMILHKIEWWPGITSLADLIAEPDTIKCALTGRDDLTDLEPTNLSVYVSTAFSAMAATPTPLVNRPFVQSFTELPGGGLLLPLNPVYLGILSSSIAAAASVKCVLYYTFKKLSDRETLELLQTLLPGNVG